MLWRCLLPSSWLVTSLSRPLLRPSSAMNQCVLVCRIGKLIRQGPEPGGEAWINLSVRRIAFIRRLCRLFPSRTITGIGAFVPDARKTTAKLWNQRLRWPSGRRTLFDRLSVGLRNFPRHRRSVKRFTQQLLGLPCLLRQHVPAICHG